MSDKKEDLAEMLRRLAAASEGNDEQQAKAYEIVDIMLDEQGRADQVEALIRQSFLSVMMYALGVMGHGDMDASAEAIRHLRACMDAVIANRHMTAAQRKKIPGACLLHTMRPVIKEEDDV